jgi:hypothetical protein
MWQHGLAQGEVERLISTIGGNCVLSAISLMVQLNNELKNRSLGTGMVRFELAKHCYDWVTEAHA